MLKERPKAWVTGFFVAMAFSFLSYTVVTVILDTIDALKTVLPSHQNYQITESAATHNAIKECITNRKGLLRVYYDEYNDVYRFVCINMDTGQH